MILIDNVKYHGEQEVKFSTRAEPTLKITDAGFRYVNSASTDIRKTFERVKMACPPCNGDCNQGRNCPAKV